jgi:hypothetical protein
MKNNIIKTIVWVSVFSIAMAYLESAIVVYLRALYYPEGFLFPLKLVEKNIVVTEFFREVATVIMLAGIGIMAGRRNIEKFAFFIYSFAVWDIFYYVFLKVLLNWPGSLFTWDILFLIPSPWVGPVIAPIINSLTMILLAVYIVFYTEKKKNVMVRWPEWTLLIAGSLVVIFAYTWEYLQFMLARFSLAELLGIMSNKEILNYGCTYVPHHFNWYIFGLAEVMHLAAVWMFCKRMRREKL